MTVNLSVRISEFGRVIAQTGAPEIAPTPAPEGSLGTPIVYGPPQETVARTYDLYGGEQDSHYIVPATTA